MTEAASGIALEVTQAPATRRRRARPTPRSGRSSAPGTRLVAGARLFERYRLERPIGRGGTAEVWRAHDERLDRTVAIKVLHPHLLPDAPSAQRFVAEARAAAGLTHPAIVPVFDVIEDPETPAIVLRYVEGETLADRISRLGPMPAPEAAAIAASLAGALAHAHQVGLVHRDVKPGNVLVDADGHAQLVDFGIARALEGAEDHTAPGDVLGTLRYMAPEQLAGQPVDARTDLYALGLVLHELLAGRPAFEVTSPAALVGAQRGGPPPPPAGTPAPVADLLGELLAADPAGRPADAATVEARLRAVAESPASPAPLPDRSAIAPAAGPPHDTGAGSEADTVAFATPPTIAIAAPVLPAREHGGAPAARLPPPARGSQRRRRPGAVAIGGLLAGVAGLVLAALVLGGLGDTPAAVTRLGPTGSGQLSAAPMVEATTAPKVEKPPRGRGHGKHGDGGD